MGLLSRLTPDFIRKSYAVKFGIAFLILGLSIGLIGTIGTGQVTNEVEEIVNGEIQSTAEQEASNLENWDEENRGTIQVLAETPVVQSGETEAIDDYLDVNQLPEQAFQIDYVDTDSGEVLASSPRDIESVSEYGFPAEDRLADRERFVTTEYTYETDALSQPVISYVEPVDGGDDRALVYTVRLNEYTSEFGSYATAENVVTLVVNEDEQVIFTDESDAELFAEYDDANGVVADAFSLDAGMERSGSATHATPPSTIVDDENYGFPNEEYVVGYEKMELGDREWVMLVHTPTDDAYGFVATVGRFGTLATLIGVLVIGVVGVVLGRNTATAIDRLTTKAGRMEDGDLDVSFETDRIDNIGRLYTAFDSMQTALREQIDEAESARENAERARKRAEKLNNHLERKADEYSGVMQAAGDGDFTVRMDPESENEAMTAIARDFNEMIAAIERTTEEVKAFAQEVATASEQVTASSEEVRSASEQVSESVQQISVGAQRQNESLQSASQEMNALSTTTEEIAASSNEVADLAERTAETGSKGRDAAQEAIDGMETVLEESDSALEEIEALHEEMQEIDELTSFISEIAEQTNMIALNANIEASRSHDSSANEGFGVVATEVKELSEETKEAADAIEEIVEEIQEQTRTAVTQVRGTTQQVEDQTVRVEQAVDALTRIADYAQETNTGIQEISAATQQQAATTQEVVTIVDEAATISEETTSEAESVAAAAEEQTSALSEVTGAAQQLTDQSTRLLDILDEFETEATTGSEPSALEGESTDTADLVDDAESLAEATEPEDDTDPLADDTAPEDDATTRNQD
ncbi:methyl-accepting chemotaxis protein [Halopiger djelfimassiliensis]|uniref:methyl-accepting chemotaxis protein n=1 Tax=Halopiger djelfimassiliensis TaxID=1293047 RepID=UPI0006780653|nr:methyl-accepting chemotaxis protein [Halopiger djelfimassiliensis]